MALLASTATFDTVIVAIPAGVAVAVAGAIAYRARRRKANDAGGGRK